jgi:hypothetical protein
MKNFNKDHEQLVYDGLIINNIIMKFIKIINLMDFYNISNYFQFF